MTKKEIKQAAWIALGPAIIENPMKYIYSKEYYKDVNATVARIAACNGDGDTVSKVARRVYNAWTKDAV